MIEFQRTELANGIKVLSEKHPQSRVLALSIWIDSGSGDESKSLCGVSHLVEHMVFKGTEKYSAYNLVADLEAVGAEINAFTSRENTCFHTLSLGEHLDLSISVLADLVCRAKFPKEEYDKERQVVMQELKMGEDSPEEHIFDVFFQRAYPKRPVGRPILGTMKTLNNITRSMLIKYYRERYVGRNMYVVAVGAVEHEHLLRKVEELLGHVPRGEKTRKPKVATMQKFLKIMERELEHVHLLVGLPAPTFMDTCRTEGAVVSSLIGGGMASRLYQEIREKHALAYTVYTYQHIQMDTGVEFVYSSTEPRRINKLLKCMFSEFKKLRDRGISKKEIEMAKTQLKGQVLLASEEFDFRVNSLATGEMLLGAYRSVDNIIEEIEAVTHDRVNEYVRKYWDPKQMGILLLGSVDGDRTKEIIGEILDKVES